MGEEIVMGWLYTAWNGADGSVRYCNCLFGTLFILHTSAVDLQGFFFFLCSLVGDLHRLWVLSMNHILYFSSDFKSDASNRYITHIMESKKSVKRCTGVSRKQSLCGWECNHLSDIFEQGEYRRLVAKVTPVQSFISAFLPKISGFKQLPMHSPSAHRHKHKGMVPGGGGCRRQTCIMCHIYQQFPNSCIMTGLIKAVRNISIFRVATQTLCNIWDF